MSAKITASRRRAFLTYLAQSGNQTLSAERAKVSRSWVQLHRSTDAEFDAACRAAIEEARVRLSAPPHPAQPAAESPSPAKGRGAGWRYHDGAELVVESVVAGTGGSGGGKRVQVRRARVKQWTPRVEERFLAALAATCNVKAACAEVGLWPPSAYNHRNRWPDFARRWDEAIETGYVRIEAALVEHGCNSFEPREGAPEVETASGNGECPPDIRLTPIMTVEQAIHVLHMHKHQVRGIGKRPGLPEREATEAEVERELKKAVRRLDSWLAREERKKAVTK